MSKFKRFSYFIEDKMLYPLTITLIVTLIPLLGWFVFETEWMWAVWAAFILDSITVIWLLLSLFCLICNKIIDYREEKRLKAKQYEKCKTCDHYDDSTDSCLYCNHGNRYQHILIEKDESEE